MTKNIFSAIISVTLITLVLNSCKKPEVDTETQSATDNAICEAEFTALMPNTTSKAITTKGISGIKMASTALPWIYTDSIPGSQWVWPRRVWIDFDKDATGNPTSGFLDVDGRLRKGRLSMVVDTAWVTAKSATMTIDSLVNYTVNGVKYWAKFVSFAKSGTSYTTVVENGKCETSTWWLQWSGTRTFTYVNKGQTNEEVHVTGSATGVNKNGLGYTANISSPIIKSTSCTYISSGTIDITPSGKDTRTIDYSVDASGKHNNACDKSVALTIKGNTFIFNID